MYRIGWGTAMKTVDEIKQALARAFPEDREEVSNWLQGITAGNFGGYVVNEPKMAYAIEPPPLMTVEEYLEFSEKSPVRYEYINGVVYAMSAPSLAHIRIMQELFVALRSHLRGGPCEAFTLAKVSIRSEADEIFYHPDVTVDCHPEHRDPRFVSSPKVIAEVLSPSTSHIDRREKALSYHRIATVEEYALLSQDEFSVTVQRREDAWRPQVYSGPQAVVEFRSINLSIPLSQIYAGTLEGGPGDRD
jgi:Uma2 family endonuclease